MPALSILLPTFNGSRFLGEQIQSILAQTWGDFELLAIDDGSTDDTRDLLARHAGQDRRIRLLPSDGNLGQKRRLRELARESRAELVAIADQDDIWAADKLSRLLDRLGSADLAFGSSWLVDAAGTALGRTVSDSFPPAPRAGDRLSYLFRPAVSAHAMLGRRALFGDATFARLVYFDMLQAVDAAFGRGVVHVPDAITYHRIHDANQANGSLARREGIKDRLKPGAIHRHIRQLGPKRLTFFQVVEHLAYSDVVPLDTARHFMRVLLRCRWAWFDTGRLPRMRDMQLRRDLVEMLEPFAGSQTDWDYATRQIETLTQSPLHPGWLRQALSGP